MPHGYWTFEHPFIIPALFEYTREVMYYNFYYTILKILETFVTTLPVLTGMQLTFILVF